MQLDNGAFIYFGSPRHFISSDVDFVVDLRKKVLGDNIKTNNVVRYPCYDKIEPYDIYKFRKFMDSLQDKVKDGKNLFFIDNYGMANGAMAAWVILCKNIARPRDEIYAEMKVKMVNSDTYTREELRFAPIRFDRIKSYGKLLISELLVKSFSNLFLTRAYKSNNICRIKTQKGDLRVGWQAHDLSIEANKWAHKIEKYYNARIFNSKTSNNFNDLHTESVGPYHVTYVDQYNKYVDIEIKSLNNLILSCAVYPSHLDEKNRLNKQFFIDRIRIAQTSTPVTLHPASKFIFPIDENLNPNIQSERPLFYHWEGRNFTNVEFRYVWSTLYEALAVDHPAYKTLKSSISNGGSVCISDYFGYDFIEDNNNLETSIQNPDRHWSVSHVLYGMLARDRPWADPVTIKNFLFYRDENVNLDNIETMKHLIPTNEETIFENFG